METVDSGDSRQSRQLTVETANRRQLLVVSSQLSVVS